MYVKCGYVILWLWFAVVCHAQQSARDTLEQANDFICTLASGEEIRMYSLRAEALLLCFYDPSCEDCHALMKRLDASPVIERLSGAKKLLLLAVYPEEDATLWMANSSHVPAGWINGYDPEVKIILDNLYDFARLPALYLLDGEKRFLLKDATADEIEEELKFRFRQFKIQDSKN
ncbi:MAG: thioredoxin family protein [Tannerella sp.]|nr:thioredoxin family protein [Tannerella sp.]